MAVVHSEYSSHSLRWFLEPARPGAVARYRGRDSRAEDSMVFVPEHQREYVWPPAKQRALIESVFKGYPIPSIMVTEDDRNRYSLNDGQQRMETFWRYYTGEFAVNQKRFDQLTDDEKRTFLEYKVPIVDTTGATRDQEMEIYDLLNQGVALSHGEKFWNRRSKPIVAMAERVFLTTGIGLHARAVEIFGDYLSGEDKRHGRVANAVAYVAGVAYGSRYISTSYAKLWDVLDVGPGGDAPDEAVVIARLTKLLDVYRAADDIRRPTARKALSQWKIGLYSAYILHSILETETDEEGWQHIRTTWVQFLARSRQNINLEARLYRGTSKSSNITFERCGRVYENIVDMMNEGFENGNEVAEDDSGEESE